MEKLNVTLDIQIRLNHRLGTHMLATNGKRLIVLLRTVEQTTHFLEIDKQGNVGKYSQCTVTTDMDQAGKWFYIIGTGAINQTNIAKGLRLIKKEVITKYNGLTGLEYAQETLNETTKCAWHLNDKVYYEGKVVTPQIMDCIQTWVVEKVERIGKVDHIYLDQNNH